MLDERIKFDERYDSEENGTTTLYFIAPKEMLKKFIPTNDYPEAISMEISIEFPTDHIEPNYADVSVSPTREDENGTEDYDWYDVDIPYDEIDELIELARANEIISNTKYRVVSNKRSYGLYKTYEKAYSILNDLIWESPYNYSGEYFWIEEE